MTVGATAEVMLAWLQKKRRLESVRQARKDYAEHVKRVMRAFRENERAAERDLAKVNFTMPEEPATKQ